MSKEEPKKLKGIVSISSEDYMSKENQNEKNTTNNNNNQKLTPNTSPSKTQQIKKSNNNRQTSSSSSKSLQLPDSFFEQILDCEFKLKEKFEVKTFYELINLYSSAINFYESIKDPRFITYNQSLNLLFSMPEVKKFMEGKKSLTKKEKINDIEKRMLQSEKKITKERVNKIYLSKIQKNLGINIINNEFNKQSNIFKKRKEEKRKKYLLSTSAIETGKKQELHDDNHEEHEDNQNINKKQKMRGVNKSMDIIIPKDDSNGDEDSDSQKKIFKTSERKINPLSLNNYYGENNVFDELRKEDIKNDINKISISGSGNDSANYLDDTLSFSNSDNILLDLSKIHKMTKKTLFQENIKSILDKYIKEFNDIFMEKTVNSIIKDYTESGSNLEQKLCESAVNFYGQEKEMEYLLNSGENDETYNDQLESMIQQIQDESEEAKLKIIKEGEQKAKKLNDKYINSLENIHFHKLDILKEKLKLEITKSVNSIVLK
jgi:hypothetical protein